MRLLVIGAGASIAEAEMIRPGRGKELPTMADFSKKLFQNQPIVQRTIASYLTNKGILYNPAFIEYLNSKSQQPISHEKITPTPLEVFIQLEEKTPEIHNVETIFEYAWNQFGKTQPNLWDDFIYWTIYEGIFPPFTSIFHENGVGYKNMFAGAMVCKDLTPEDSVLSLNYDTCFDLAIKQSLHNYCGDPLNPAHKCFVPVTFRSSPTRKTFSRLRRLSSDSLYRPESYPRHSFSDCWIT